MVRETEAELLNKEHYAVIVSTSRNIYHEGDERSRTHPGHGYPAYTEEIKSIEYIPFATKEEVADWVSNRWNKDKKYRIIKASPMKVETSISII